MFLRNVDKYPPGLLALHPRGIGLCLPSLQLFLLGNKYDNISIVLSQTTLSHPVPRYRLAMKRANGRIGTKLI
jgi:hypothetical protein